MFTKSAMLLVTAIITSPCRELMPSRRMYYIGSNYKLYTIYLPDAPQLPSIQLPGESSTDPQEPLNNPQVNHSSTLLRPQTLPQTLHASNVNYSPPPMLLAHEYAVFGRAMMKGRGKRNGARRTGDGNNRGGGGYGPWGWGGYMHNNWRERGYMTQSPPTPVQSTANNTSLCVRLLLVLIAVVVLCLLCVVPIMVLIDKFDDKSSSHEMNNSTLSTVNDNG